MKFKTYVLLTLGLLSITVFVLIAFKIAIYVYSFMYVLFIIFVLLIIAFILYVLYKINKFIKETNTKIKDYFYKNK